MTSVLSCSPTVFVRQPASAGVKVARNCKGSSEVIWSWDMVDGWCQGWCHSGWQVRAGSSTMKGFVDGLKHAPLRSQAGRHQPANSMNSSRLRLPLQLDELMVYRMLTTTGGTRSCCEAFQCRTGLWRSGPESRHLRPKQPPSTIFMIRSNFSAEESR